MSLDMGITETKECADEFFDWLSSWDLQHLIKPLNSNGIKKSNNFKFIKSQKQFDKLLTTLGDDISFMDGCKLEDAWRSKVPNPQQPTPQIHFLGDEEKKIFKQLNERSHSLSNDIEYVKKSFCEFNDSVKNTPQNVNDNADKMIAYINSKRTELLNKIESIKQKSHKIFHDKLEQMNKTKSILNNNKKKFNKIVLDVNVTTSKRMNLLQELLLMKKEMTYFCVIPDRILLPFDEQLFKDYIDSNFMVNGYDKISEWNLKCVSNKSNNQQWQSENNDNNKNDLFSNGSCIFCSESSQTQQNTITNAEDINRKLQPEQKQNEQIVEETRIIGDDIDETNDEFKFEHRPISAWRWDTEQNKWRGRGKGQIKIIYDKRTELARMVFMDEKHQKIRLFQYINEKDENNNNRNTLCTFINDNNDNELSIEWSGTDYAMGLNDPMIAKWKLSFNGIDNSCVQQFVNIFNGFIKPFVFSYDNNSVQLFQKQTTHETVPNESPINVNSVWINAFKQQNNNNKNDNDNGLKNPFSAIVELEETKVDTGTGHENETLLISIKFSKLYRFGKDMTNEATWKIRATNSNICFYKSNINHKIRIIAREQETNKLRMNQFVPIKNNASFSLKKINVYSWTAFDDTIAEENAKSDHNNIFGISTWCIKFQNKDQSQQILFEKYFNDAMENNEKLLSPFSPINYTQIQQKQQNQNEIHTEIDNKSNEKEQLSFGNIQWGDNVQWGDEKQEQTQEEENDKQNGSELSTSWDIGGGDKQVFGNVNNNAFGLFSNDSNEFNFDSIISNELQDTVSQIQQNNNEQEQRVNNDNNNNDDDDNGIFTLKPIVNLEEVEVETGHENEEKLKEFDIRKLYRWGKDVTHEPYWKNRASATSLIFYQSKNSGIIRLVCREHITNKLRLNQYIGHKKVANIEKKNEKQIRWNGFDVTIEEEDKAKQNNSENNGFCMFAAKFTDKDTANEFYDFFMTASENNQQLS